MVTSFDIGQRIRSARRSRGLKAAQLAKAVGVSRAAVHKWEWAGACPRPHTLAAIADILGVSAGYLRSGSGGGDPGLEAGEEVGAIVDEARRRIARAARLPIEEVEIDVRFLRETAAVERQLQPEGAPARGRTVPLP